MYMHPGYVPLTPQYLSHIGIHPKYIEEGFIKILQIKPLNKMDLSYPYSYPASYPYLFPIPFIDFPPYLPPYVYPYYPE